MTEATEQSVETRPRRFRPYPEYRDSGVEWLGEIPAHWDVQRADRRLAILKRPVVPHEIRGQDVFHYSIPNVQQFGSGVVERAETIDSSKTAIEHPSLLVSKLNPRKGTIAIASPHQTLMTLASTEFVAMKSTECMLEFTRYFYLSVHVKLELSARVESATRSHQRCSPDDISKLPISWPSIAEQRAIAAFLDRETAKIDALVARKERLIELLQEKRTALITRAVTRGLDPNVPMKDSGVEWLGEIPAHWDVRPLKRISPEITVGVVVNPSTYVRMDGVPFLYGSDIQEGRIVAHAARRMSEEDSKSLSKSCLRPGDLVCVRVGAPGVTAVVPPELAGANCASVLIVRHTGSFESKWLCYVMNSRSVRYQVELVQYGAAQEQFNVAHAAEFLVPLAPQAEQRAIAAFFDRETAKIDTLITKVRDAINHLKEFRTALISAAVTGKIDVREGMPR